MPQIDFEAKTDRELLLLVAQNSNTQDDRSEKMEKHLAKINGRISKHEARITSLEAIENYDYQPSLAHRLLSNNLFSFGVGGTLIGGILYALGNGIGWW